MDDFPTDLDVENGFEEEQDDWFGEDEIQLNGTPEQLWSDHPIDATPALHHLNHGLKTWQTKQR